MKKDKKNCLIVFKKIFFLWSFLILFDRVLFFSLFSNIVLANKSKKMTQAKSDLEVYLADMNKIEDFQRLLDVLRYYHIML